MKKVVAIKKYQLVLMGLGIIMLILAASFFGLIGILISSLLLGMFLKVAEESARITIGIPVSKASFFSLTIAFLEMGIFLAVWLLSIDSWSSFLPLALTGLIVGPIFFFIGQILIGWTTKKRQMKECDVILLFAFGGSYENNEPLMSLVDRKFPVEIPVFTQKSISGWLKRYNKHRPIFEAQQPSNFHLSTYGLIEKFLAKTQEENWTKVYLVAAKPHHKRCRRDILKSGIEPVETLWVNVPYYCEDKQPWTRDSINFWFREVIIKLIPFPIYQYICR